MTPTESLTALTAAARGLLVDLDGTLVDSSAPVQRVWTAFARRHGLDPGIVLHHAHGRPARATIADLAPPAVQADEVERVEESECTDTRGTRALPGAARLLRDGRKLAIVTSCSARLAPIRLRAAGLPVPATIISADDVADGKPDPECFRLGARALGLAPGDCLALEDSPAGIAAARAAGVPVIAVRTTHDDAELTGASAIVADLSALPG